MDKKIRFLCYYNLYIFFINYLLRPILACRWNTIKALEVPSCVPTKDNNQKNDEDGKEDAALSIW